VLSGLERDPVEQELVDGSRPAISSLLAFASRNRVALVIATVTAGYPTDAQLRAFGPVERIGGVLVAPGCGEPPLTNR
jgi:hypothetical protein